METLQSTAEALENYARICNDYCEKAHKILQEQADPSPVAGWAREVIDEQTGDEPDDDGRWDAYA